MGEVYWARDTRPNRAVALKILIESPNKVRLWFNTGDLIFCAAREPVTDRTRELWAQLRIPFEVLAVDDVRRTYPVIDLTGITVALHEPRAGVVRARRRPAGAPVRQAALPPDGRSTAARNAPCHYEISASRDARVASIL